MASSAFRLSAAKLLTLLSELRKHLIERTLLLTHLAFVGGIAGLWLTNQNLSVPASVGFIALFGIALANGMVLENKLMREIKAYIKPHELSAAKLRKEKFKSQLMPDAQPSTQQEP